MVSLNESDDFYMRTLITASFYEYAWTRLQRKYQSIIHKENNDYFFAFVVFYSFSFFQMHLFFFIRFFPTISKTNDE